MASNLQGLTDGGGDTATARTPEPCGVAGPEADRDERTGRFVRGNRAALIVGGRSTAFWAAVAGEQDARRAAILRDKGYTNGEAPEALRAVVDGAVQAVLLRDAAFTRVIEVGGPLSLRGRNRAVFRVWLEASDRAASHMKLLGLDRHERKASTLTDYLAQQETQP